MKIDGTALIAARQKVRANFPGRGEIGSPSTGTQEWLAEQAKVSIRALQYLERGEGSLSNLKKVCTALGISQWQQLIINYGEDYVNCIANRFVDFRPSIYPPENPETFANSGLLMTLDPLTLLVAKGKFENILLQEVNATLTGLAEPITYTWLAEVSLTPNGQGWLGWVKEVEPMNLLANDVPLNVPIMLKQLRVPHVSWGEFVCAVENLTTSQLNIDVCLVFQNFTKKFTVYVSVDLLKVLFNEGRNKYRSPLPYRAQLKAIV
jgi:hypothetical protein